MPTILIIFIVLGSSTFVSQYVFQAAIESLISNELFLVVRTSEKLLDSWLALCKESVIRAGEMPYPGIGHPSVYKEWANRALLSKSLLERASQYDYVDAFGLIDNDGVLISSSHPERDADFQREIRRALDVKKMLAGETVLGDIFKTRRSGKFMFLIGVPIFEERRVVGSVVGRIRFAFFGRNYLRALTIGESGYILLYNRNGESVFHPETVARSANSLIQYLYGVHVDRKNPELSDVITVNGTLKHRTVRYCSHSGWMVAMVVSASEVMAPLNRVGILNLFLLLFSAVLVGVVAFGFSKLVTSPLKRSVRFAKAIRSGEFPKSVGVTSNDEIGQLAGALEGMADELKGNMASLADTNRALKYEREVAEAANQAKSQFLANMSHEIRTPMNAIMGFTLLMKQSDLTAKQQEYLSKIDGSSKALLVIINDIFDFSKIEAGKLVMEQIPFHLGQLMARIESIFKISALDRGIEFRTIVDSDVPPALIGDPLRMSQVLINLTGNAVKFTESGKIGIRVSLDSRGSENCTLLFSVSDTGIGLDEAQIDNLFAPFSQVDASITRKFGGTGIGLSICRRLVELMGGEISVESAVGVGSTFSFTVTLPIQGRVGDVGIEGREAARVLDRMIPIDISPNDTVRKREILLVDDNLVNQQVAREILEEAGMHVDVVENGKEAVKSVEEKDYDLVLMDIQMPIMGGEEATRRIRQHERFSNLPIVAMTAQTPTHSKNRCLEVGMNDYITKPIESGQLFTVLTRWMGVIPFTDFRRAPMEEADDTPFIVFLKKSNLPGLDWKRGLLRINGNQTLYRQLLVSFCNEFASVSEEIGERIKNREIESAEQMIHAVKGAAGNISAISLHRTASAVEKFIRQRAFGDDGLTNSLQKLDHQLKPLVDAVGMWQKEEIATLEAETSLTLDSMDREKIVSVIDALARYLARNETGAINAFTSLKRLLPSASFSAHIHEMEKKMNNFDYDSALLQLRELSEMLDIQIEDRLIS